MLGICRLRRRNIGAYAAQTGVKPTKAGFAKARCDAEFVMVMQGYKDDTAPRPRDGEI